MLQFQAWITTTQFMTAVVTVRFSGADDGVPAASLERVAGSHAGAPMQQAGGGPALQHRDARR